MRVIRDAVGDVTKNGEVLHAGVRFQMDDQKRVAVYPSSKTVSQPTIVYGPGEVDTVTKRKPCSCKGDAARMSLVLQWITYDKVTV